MTRVPARSRRSRADGAAEPGRDTLEGLLGAQRLSELVRAALGPDGTAVRGALRALATDLDLRAGQRVTLTEPSDADRTERELLVAQRIQRSLVLIAETSLEGWEIVSDYRPARQIGGDFFDAYPIAEPGRGRRLGFVIADVSGKGISAAMLMAFVRPVMRAALDRTANPAEALERTNRILVDERRTGLFVTALCGVLDLRTGLARLANAGHERPILVPGDGSPPRAVGGSGPLLGAFGRLEADEVQLELRPNDALVMYTDGVTDAADPTGARFGDRRLAKVLRRVQGGAARQLCAGIISAVTRFQGDAPAADDLALLIMRRAG